MAFEPIAEFLVEWLVGGVVACECEDGAGGGLCVFGAIEASERAVAEVGEGRFGGGAVGGEFEDGDGFGGLSEVEVAAGGAAEWFEGEFDLFEDALVGADGECEFAELFVECAEEVPVEGVVAVECEGAEAGGFGAVVFGESGEDAGVEVVGLGVVVVVLEVCDDEVAGFGEGAALEGEDGALEGVAVFVGGGRLGVGVGGLAGGEEGEGEDEGVAHGEGETRGGLGVGGWVRRVARGGPRVSFWGGGGNGEVVWMQRRRLGGEAASGGVRSQRVVWSVVRSGGLGGGEGGDLVGGGCAFEVFVAAGAFPEGEGRVALGHVVEELHGRGARLTIHAGSPWC